MKGSWEDREREKKERAARVDAMEKKRRIRNIVAGILVALAAIALVVSAQQGLFSGVDLRPERKAPDFTLTDSEGHEFSLRATDGQPRLLFFMTASDWCEPCKRETAGPLRDIEAVYGSNVTMLSIEMVPQDILNGHLNAFKDRYNVSWPHARDTAGVAQLYGVRFLSIVVILDQEGVVKFQRADPTFWQMANVIEDLGVKPERSVA